MKHIGWCKGGVKRGDGGRKGVRREDEEALSSLVVHACARQPHAPGSVVGIPPATVRTVELLQAHPVADGAQVIAQVQAAGGLHARQHALAARGGGGLRGGAAALGGRLGGRVAAGGGSGGVGGPQRTGARLRRGAAQGAQLAGHRAGDVAATCQRRSGGHRGVRGGGVRSEQGVPHEFRRAACAAAPWWAGRLAHARSSAGGTGGCSAAGRDGYH